MNAPFLPFQAPEPVRHRFTVSDVRRLEEVEVLSPDAPTELIDGELFDMASEGGPHQNYKAELNHFFVLALAPERRVRLMPDGTLHLSETDAPKPDLYLLDAGATVEPVDPGAVQLVIEVADSSASRDLELKAPLYSGYGIKEYWVVDVKERLTHVHRGPTAEGYADRASIPFAADLRPLFGSNEIILRIADLPFLDLG